MTKSNIYDIRRDKFEQEIIKILEDIEITTDEPTESWITEDELKYAARLIYKLFEESAWNAP